MRLVARRRIHRGAGDGVRQSGTDHLLGGRRLREPFAAYGISAGYDYFGGMLSFDASSPQNPIWEMHGTADTNVPFEQSARLVDTLLKNHKDVEFMMYPGEFHYFRREHVLRDAWRRIERFFDDHLRDGAKHPAPAPPAFEKERP